MPPTLASLHRYPVKSCRGWDLASAVVEPWGLAGDRRWMVTDPAGYGLTAREHRRLLLAEPEVLDDGRLRLHGPGLEPLVVDVPAPGMGGDGLLGVHVWSTALDAAPASQGAADWFSTLIGEPARLVYLDDPTRRATSPAFTDPGDRVSFADGYPLLVTTTASLDALNGWIAQGRRPFEGPVPMVRFRPNVVIEGTAAWAEDGWRRIRIGEAEFRAVKGCSRCVMTMTDAVTIERGKEPLATLARHRRWDHETWFGMNLVPSTPGAVIHTGDPVEILEAVPAPDGPPR